MSYLLRWCLCSIDCPAQHFVHLKFLSRLGLILCCPCRVPLWHHHCSAHHMVALHAAQPPRQHHSGTRQHTRGPQHHHCCAHHMVALHAAQPPRQHHSSTRQHPSDPRYHPIAHMPCLPLRGQGQRVEPSLWPAVPSLPVLWPHATSHFRWVVLTVLLPFLCLSSAYNKPVLLHQWFSATSIIPQCSARVPE